MQNKTLGLRKLVDIAPTALRLSGASGIVKDRDKIPLHPLFEHKY